MITKHGFHFFMLVSVFWLLPNKAMTAPFYDPFYNEENLHCDEQASILLGQLKAWQFKGVVMQKSPVYQTIWLSSDTKWLMVSADQIPKELLPWSIKQIYFDKVIWQISASHGCNDPLVWTMALPQKPVSNKTAKESAN